MFIYHLGVNLDVSIHLLNSISETDESVAAPRGKGLRGGHVTPNATNRQKLSKKNGIKLVGYTFRLKKHANGCPKNIPTSLKNQPKFSFATYEDDQITVITNIFNSQ